MLIEYKEILYSKTKKSKTTKRKSRTPKFELYKDKSGEYRFRLKAPNSEIIAIGEGYRSKNSCMNGIRSVIKNSLKANIVDLT